MRKNKLIAFLLALTLVFSIGLAGCQKAEPQAGGATSTTDAQSGAESTTGIPSKVIIGVDDSFPPMGFRDENNNLVGFDIDVANEVFKRLNIEIEILPIDWTAKEVELNSKKVDLLWNGYTITDERKEKVLFSDPYLNNFQVLVVKQDSSYKTRADLAGKKLALQSGSSAEEALDADAEFKATLSDVNGLTDNLKAFMELETGMSDAVLVDEVVANYYITAQKKPFKILDDKLSAEEYGVGFRKEDTALRNKVNDELIAMVKDGTMAEISTKWFGSDVTIIGK